MNGLCWLASYPKSGNTWARLALASLRLGGTAVDFRDWEMGGGRDPAAFQRWRFDAGLDIDSSDLTEEEVLAARPEAFRALARELHGSVTKVHEAFIRTPTGEFLFPPDVTAGAVYLVRDPRDVAVSLANHMGTSLDATIALMNDPDACFSRPGRRLSRQLHQPLLTWSRHVVGWLDEPPFPVTLVRYEDMLADPAGSLERLAAAFHIDTTPEAVAKAVAATRFDVLRAQEATHGFHERPPTATAPFFRKGKAGGWRAVLSVTQAARIEADHGEVMERLGYLPAHDFPAGERN